MAVSLEGALFPKEVVRTCARSYVAYLLNYRHVAELGQERGVNVDHATVHRWVVKYSPHLEEAFHRRKWPVWLSWQMDETSIKVKGANRARRLFTSVGNEADSCANRLNRSQKPSSKVYPEEDLMASIPHGSCRHLSWEAVRKPA
jgi:hypothetical protein